MSNPTEQNLEQAVEDALVRTLSSPKRVESEAGSVEQHSLTDLVAADKYLSQKRAAQQGFQFVKINSK
jgi:hypothetical protein